MFSLWQFHMKKGGTDLISGLWRAETETKKGREQWDGRLESTHFDRKKLTGWSRTAGRLEGRWRWAGLKSINYSNYRLNWIIGSSHFMQTVNLEKMNLKNDLRRELIILRIFSIDQRRTFFSVSYSIYSSQSFMNLDEK